MKKEDYVKTWITKADGDLKVAERELSASDSVLDAVCFHLQQAVEKLIKAFLSNEMKNIRKTHNILFLLEQCIKIDSDFKKFEKEFDLISECSVEIRYPDSFLVLEKTELQDVLPKVKEFREFVLSKVA